MKKFFISPLFYLALVLALPLPMSVKADDEYAKCGCNANKPSRDAEDKCGCNANKPPRGHDLVEFIAQLSALDEDESSPLHKLNELVREGDFVVSKDDFIAALDHAQSVIVEYNDLISDEQIEHIGNTFNALVDVVTQESDSVTRDSDDDSALKIRKILTVLNKAIFCDVVVFRDEAVFCKHVEMKGSLSVRRLRAHKAKIDKLEAKKAKIKKLKAKEIETVDLTVTGEVILETLEVLTSATVDCDLTVGCNIFMNDSISPAIGNVYKAGVPFIHNFGVDNTFVGDNAGNFTMTGSSNAGFGNNALLNNTIGINNTAIGSTALQNNTTGTNNTASGQSALLNNTTGNFNTASGQSALLGNTTGAFNTASGAQALNLNTTGSNNVAVGFIALQNNATGNNNTALGEAALQNSLTGSNNIAVGSGAGSALTGAESDNIYVGNAGVLGESAAIRIGTLGTQTTNFQAGIRGVTTGIANAIPVLIDSNGQLGTMSSSIRYKTNIEDINERSAALLNLRPVSYTYKVDSTDTPHFGFIAEEVNDVLPLLVIRNGDGTIETIRYQDVIALLVNEYIKLHARVTLLEEQVNY